MMTATVMRFINLIFGPGIVEGACAPVTGQPAMIAEASTPGNAMFDRHAIS